MPDLSLELKYKDKIVCGVDEVGRGCLAGDVYACAIILHKNFPKDILDQLQDSKKIPAKKREYLAGEIKKHANYSIGIATVEEIDDINILHAAMLAMERAVKDLSIRPNVCLIDGNRSPKLDDYTVETIIKGDSKSSSIAAASILAKVFRDKKMAELSEEFTFYSWEKNAGYGTKAHLEGMDQNGITKWHRKSFAPVKKFL